VTLDPLLQWRIVRNAGVFGLPTNCAARPLASGVRFILPPLGPVGTEVCVSGTSVYCEVIAW